VKTSPGKEMEDNVQLFNIEVSSPYDGCRKNDVNLYDQACLSILHLTATEVDRQRSHLLFPKGLRKAARFHTLDDLFTQ
jgi:hypothetical protein